MEFETMDWKSEAQRVMMAFDVAEECEFVDESNFFGPTKILSLRRSRLVKFWKRFFHLFIRPRIDKVDKILTQDGMLLLVSYRLDTGKLLLYFTLTENKPMTILDRAWASVCFSPDGSLVRELLLADSNKYAVPLAKGLFHLGLLSPEIEAALKIAVSAHQKMEWTLEYEASYGTSMNS